MALTQVAAFSPSLIPTVSPVVATNGKEFSGVGFDHVKLFITFTLDTLTDCKITIEQSLNGTTWFSAYSANQAECHLTFTADFTGSIEMGVPANAPQMMPLAIAAPLFRVVATPSGSAGSSSLLVDGIPYNLGHHWS